ncbi:MAG: hypothetical protein ABIR68_03310, partial [Ilumatobacteraceae bacterium]
HDGPLVEEAKRFAGGHLVYANVEPGMMRRLQEALGEPTTSTPTPTSAGSDELPPPPADATPADPLEAGVTNTIES